MGPKRTKILIIHKYLSIEPCLPSTTLRMTAGRDGTKVAKIIKNQFLCEKMVFSL